MQVHHRSGLRTRAIERAMHEHLLRRPVAADVTELRIQPRQPRRIEPAEARIGRRDQIAAADPWQSHADVARAADREAAREQAGGEFNQKLAGVLLRSCHASSMANALVKKSGAPKLPDFSASSSRRAAALRIGPRHAGIDLRADAQTADAEPLHHRARRLAARHDQATHARIDDGRGDLRQGGFDQRTGGITPELRLHGGNRIGWRRCRDDDRRVAQACRAPNPMRPPQACPHRVCQADRAAIAAT